MSSKLSYSVSETGSRNTKEHVDAVGKVLLLSAMKQMVAALLKPIGGMLGAPVTKASREAGVTSPSAPVQITIIAMSYLQMVTDTQQTFQVLRIVI